MAFFTREYKVKTEEQRKIVERKRKKINKNKQRSIKQKWIKNRKTRKDGDKQTERQTVLNEMSYKLVHLNWDYDYLVGWPMPISTVAANPCCFGRTFEV